MAQLTVLEEFQSAIRAAAQEAEPKATSRAVATKFFEDYPDLVRQFRDDWILEKLASLIAKHRLKSRREQDLQYQLGFGHMPRKIELRSGKVIARDDATISGLLQLAVHLRARKHPALMEVENAIIVMAKYTGKGRGKKQRITWAEVIELEAKKKAK